MAILTREQFNKWNAQAQNGFGFDIERYVVWNEKTLTKNINHADGSIIRFRLEYYPEVETIENEYGYRYNQRTGQFLPTLQIDRLRPTRTEGCYGVQSVKKITVGNAEKSQKYAVLCKISGIINIDDYIKDIA